MKETWPNPNQLIVISKEASVWSLGLVLSLRRTAHSTSHRAPGCHLSGMSSGTTNMPAV